MSCVEKGENDKRGGCTGHYWKIGWAISFSFSASAEKTRHNKILKMVVIIFHQVGYTHKYIFFFSKLASVYMYKYFLVKKNLLMSDYNSILVI